MPENPLADMTDEALVAASLRDSAYFNELVLRYEEKLRRYIRRIGRVTNEDVEDILQEVFMKLYLNLNAFNPKLSFSSWVYRITHNETMTFFRKRKVRPQGHQIDLLPEVFENLASEIDSIGEVEAAELHEALRKSIDTLSEKYREVIVLKYFEYKNYDEISDILKIPPGTVATRLARARNELARHLNHFNHG